MADAPPPDAAPESPSAPLTGAAAAELPRPRLAECAALERLDGLARSRGGDRDRRLDADPHRLSRRAADRDRVQVGRRRRGRQDRDPLQGSGDRQGRLGRPARRPQARRRRRPAQPLGSELRGRRLDLLGGAAAHRRRRRERPGNALLGSPTSPATPASRTSRAASSSASRRRRSSCAASRARCSSCASDDLGSLDVGSPVFHRRTPVGRVVGYTLDADRDDLSLKIFVEAPFHKLVTRDSHFWNASGIDLTLNASGLSVNTQTLASVLAGGLAFDLPPGAPRGDPAPENTVFTLFADRRAALAPPDGNAVPIRMVFDQSIRGLSPGRCGRPARRRHRPGPLDRAAVRRPAQALPGRGRRRDLSAAPRPGANGAAARCRHQRRRRRHAAPGRERPARPAAHRQPAHRPALRRARLHSRSRARAGPGAAGRAGAAALPAPPATAWCACRRRRER